MQLTKEIFDILSRGGFICSDSVNRQTKQMYDAIEDNYEQYMEYYRGVGFNLESGNGYYYFSRDESRVELESKLDRFTKWIDRLDFLKTFNSIFGPGFSFRASNILERIAADIELKEKARNLYAEKLKIGETVEKLLDELAKTGFIELENELEGVWKVTSSFHYLEEMIDCITITEDLKNEMPE